MTKQRKISDILWKAANVYLAERPAVLKLKTSTYSCNAINLAITNGAIMYDSEMKGKHAAIKKRIMQGLENMGLQLDKYNYCQPFMNHYKTTYGEDSQMARYGWLMFAYEIALEQGV